MIRLWVLALIWSAVSAFGGTLVRVSDFHDECVIELSELQELVENPLASPSPQTAEMLDRCVPLTEEQLSLVNASLSQDELAQLKERAQREHLLKLYRNWPTGNN